MRFKQLLISIVLVLYSRCLLVQAIPTVLLPIITISPSCWPIVKYQYRVFLPLIYCILSLQPRLSDEDSLHAVIFSEADANTTDKELNPKSVFECVWKLAPLATPNKNPLGE